MVTMLMPARTATPVAPSLDDLRYEAIARRDKTLDGFYVAVRTTRIFCRPTCPSRTPKRENVTFYLTRDEALAAGYRACKRCKPEEDVDPKVSRITDLCDYIRANPDEKHTLKELADIAELSPFHLQRAFKKATGLSPKEYVRAVRNGTLRRELSNGRSVTDATYEAGYGSSSRVYESARVEFGMSPGTYRRNGAGMTIRYAIVDSSLGRLLVGATQVGVASVCLGSDDRALEADLYHEYPAATIERDDAGMGDWINGILECVEGRRPNQALPIDIQGTAFQRLVWQALTRIPDGEYRTYSEIAADIGHPKAARAVGNACNQNPVGVVIPCHRVLASHGGIGGYRGGLTRKRELLRREGVGAILFTDVVDSTGIVDRLGDEAGEQLLEEHRETLRRIVDRHDGAEVKSTGDGFLFWFVSPKRAVECAIEASARAGLPLRVGVHAGEPVFRSDDIHGVSVHVAGRICRQAEPGQVVVSRVVRDLLDGKGFAFQDLGNVELRGYSNPMGLYAVAR